MDREEFARKVDVLLRDKELGRRLGHSGRQLADERFNFDAYMDGLERLFSRAAETGSTTQ
jgi:glycosyltransferase involved in cell wall biosynthesis